MKSNFVLFRLLDDQAIYVADLEAGTVERRESDEAETDLASVAREGHEAAVRGVEFAFASSSRATGASHALFPNR